MSDFKVGDEVTPINNDAWSDWSGDWGGQPPPGPEMGKVYTVSSMEIMDGLLWLDFSEWPDMGFDARDFRKVQRRDLSAWVKQSVGNTDKLDKRKSKKVRA